MPATSLAEIVDRAETGWPIGGVPYSQSGVWNDDDGRTDEDGYRRDCSGFASMALGLPPWGLSTVTLVTSGAVERISWAEMQAGDLVMLGGPGTGGNAGHVGVVVHRSGSTYTILHQGGGLGPDRWTGRVGTAVRAGMVPYRSTYITGGEPMLGLKRGDTGPRVRALQAVLHLIGLKDLVGDADGDYGPKTSAGVLAARKSVGSRVTSGDEIDHWAYAQLLEALADARARKRAGAPPADVAAAVRAELTKLKATTTITLGA